MRLKQYLEVRGCDAGSLEMIEALGVLAHGILYDDAGRDAATALTAGLSFAERLELRRTVPRAGLRARVGKRTVGELVTELVAIAREAVGRSAPDELGYLAPLVQIAEEQRTQADRVGEVWRRAAGDRAAVIRALSYPGLTGGL
jgi:glutamate--cysteine ligase